MNKIEHHLSSVTLTQALSGNAMVSLVTLANIDMALRILLLLASILLTLATLYYKIKRKGK